MDPIVPGNHGGTGDLSNLQASYTLREEGCVFFWLEGSGRVLVGNELVLCIADADPVVTGGQSGGPADAWSGWVGATPA